MHLETGSMDYFAAARRLYARHGFVETGPFGDYTPDPLSTFMVLRLGAASDRDGGGAPAVGAAMVR